MSAESAAWGRTVVDAARTIRGELPYLLGAAAPPVARRLDGLLTKAVAAPNREALAAVAHDILDLFAERGQTRRRIAELLTPRRPCAAPGIDGDTGRTRGGMQPLPGSVTVDTDRYICELCDYQWPILDADEEPPGDCPRCDEPLVFRSASA